MPGQHCVACVCFRLSMRCQDSIVYKACVCFRMSMRCQDSIVYKTGVCFRLYMRCQQCQTALCTKPVSVSDSIVYKTCVCFRLSIRCQNSIVYKACVCFRLSMRCQQCQTAFCTKPFTCWTSACTLGPKPFPMWSVPVLSSLNLCQPFCCHGPDQGSCCENGLCSASVRLRTRSCCKKGLYSA